MPLGRCVSCEGRMRYEWLNLQLLAIRFGLFTLLFWVSVLSLLYPLVIKTLFETNLNAEVNSLLPLIEQGQSGWSTQGVAIRRPRLQTASTGRARHHPMTRRLSNRAKVQGWGCASRMIFSNGWAARCMCSVLKREGLAFLSASHLAWLISPRL